MFNIKTILHPTDFSPDSQAAFEQACSLAHHHGARVIVLHVAERPPVFGEGINLTDPVEHQNRLWEYLNAIMPVMPIATIERILGEGDAVREILEAAERWDADLIVMGTHGRGVLGRMLLGSVADQIVRRAPCPVMTVRRPAPTPRPAVPTAAAVDDAVGVGSVFGVWP